ncbi:MAG: FAD-dependent oxidoreductase [Nocardioides sp.]
MTTPRRIAVVGSGVAGLTAAWISSRTAHVTLFEADERLGGHADTHLIACPEEGPPGSSRRDDLGIDTGFIVHNERTYPTLLRLFAELGVRTQESEMSMSVRDDASGLEWAGALGARGLFPATRNLRPAYLRMLTEIPRFHRAARALLADDARDTRTLREFVAEQHFTPYFIRHFMEPVVAAVWSCDPAVALDYPAAYLFTFLDHHGMLGVFGSPTWRTVTGGSREYVERVGAALPDVRLGAKVTSVAETGTGVEIADGNGEVTAFDAVVIAAHPDQALSMLAAPTDLQREVLGAMACSANPALLHTDEGLLPQAPGARASWNFQRVAGDRGGKVTVTYDLTRLQRLPTETHYLVTLGGDDLVDPAKIIDRMEYAHPLYNPASVAAQQRLPEIDSDRVVFAGAYHGWGFHEDGARSGAAAAERLGLPWPKPDRPPAPRTSPSLYQATIQHTRRTPFRRTFNHRTHFWVVDLDELPDRGVLGTFEARDHLGDPERSIRANVETFLAARDVTLGGGRILLATNARAFGYCFNPISVLWCFTGAGALAATVVEVHNTYGDRHAYLVHPDEQGRARVDKQMYVSPFHGTDGSYDLAVPVPDDRLQIAVTLHSDDEAVFSAAITGQRSDHGPWRAAPAALRGSLLIRMHGVWLWLRRLPIRPRPSHHQEDVR